MKASVSNRKPCLPPRNNFKRQAARCDSRERVAMHQFMGVRLSSIRDLRRIKSIPKRRGGGVREITVASEKLRTREKTFAKCIRGQLSGKLHLSHPHIVLRKIIGSAEHGYNCAFRGDLTNYFDSIDQETLLRQLACDPFGVSIQNDIADWLSIPWVDQKGAPYLRPGIPQGSAVSGVMADYYLCGLWDEFAKSTNVRFFAYVDDLILLAANEIELDRAIVRLRTLVGELRLSLNPKKEHRAKLNKGVEYLGFDIKNDEIAVAPDRKESFRRKIKAAIMTSCRDLDLIIGSVNRVLTYEYRLGYVKTSWPRYYSFASNLQAFKDIDRSIIAQIQHRCDRSVSRNELFSRGLVSLFRLGQCYQKKIRRVTS